jgi:NAD(P)-dependent dehydrogenase (short-subunit alcohol dehydrogenase family)
MKDNNVQKSLQSRRVVIVGGTSGMGLAAARAAVQAGAEVIVAGRRSVSERSADADRDARARIGHETVDVTDETSVKTMFERIGTLDHLFITAAPKPGTWGAFLDQDVAGAQQYMNAKFFGSWACARWAAPRMPADGSITFLTGGAAVRPRVGASMVSATFAALETLARGLAIELGPLRVNAIRPGYTDSEMWSFLDPAALEQLRQKVKALMPVRRMGTVEDIGHAAIFLMSNPQVTGSVLEITGGETLVDGL